MSTDTWMQFNGFRQLAKWLIDTSRGNRFLEWFAKNYFRRIMATSTGALFHEHIRKQVEQEWHDKKPAVVIETNPDGFIRVYSEFAAVTFVNRINTYQSCEPLDEERCMLGLPLKQRDVYLNERCLVACENTRLKPSTLPELIEARTRGEVFHGMGRKKQPAS